MTGAQHRIRLLSERGAAPAPAPAGATVRP